MKVLALITAAPRRCMVAIKFFLQTFLVSDYFVCRRTRETSARPQPDDLLRPEADQKCLQALPRLAAHDAGSLPRARIRLYRFKSPVEYYLATSRPARQLPKPDASGDLSIEALPIPSGFQRRERRRQLRDRFR